MIDVYRLLLLITAFLHVALETAEFLLTTFAKAYKAALQFNLRFIDSLLFKARHGSIPCLRGLPLIGNIGTMMDQRHLKVTELSKKYGGIFRMYLGRKSVIVLTDPRLMKEALNQRAFEGRPELGLESSDSGIVNNNGEDHRNIRRMTTKVFHDLGASKNGIGRSRADEIIGDGCLQMVRELEKHQDEPVNLKGLTSACIGKILMKFLFNAERDINEEKMLDELVRIEEGFFAMKWLFLLKYLPFLKIFGFGKKNINLLKNNQEKSKRFFDSTLEESADSILMVAYAKATKNNKVKQDENGMKAYMAEMFSTGVETTKTTMLWVILYMCKYPEIQKKVQEELDGIESYATMEDERYMTYSKAVLMEVQRIVSVVFEGVSHMTVENTKLGGYTIKKGTEVYFHQYALHHDENLWEEPEKFNPERFITEEYTIDPKPDIFSPFSGGIRVCPGKRLAEMNLFILFTMLLKSFTFSLEPGTELSTEPDVEVTLVPRPYRVCIKSRKSVSS